MSLGRPSEKKYQPGAGMCLVDGIKQTWGKNGTKSQEMALGPRIPPRWYEIRFGRGTFISWHRYDKQKVIWGKGARTALSGRSGCAKVCTGWWQNQGKVRCTRPKSGCGQASVKFGIPLDRSRRGLSALKVSWRLLERPESY